jgi:hypothetical protein
VSAFGLVALAALFVGIDPFLGVGATLSSQTPAVSVNRTLKGDRLPVGNSAILDVPDPLAQFGCRLSERLPPLHGLMTSRANRFNLKRLPAFWWAMIFTGNRYSSRIKSGTGFFGTMP